MQETATQVSPGTRLERVYRQHGARLWRAVFALAGDPDVASDAVAEAFAQALGRGDAIRSPLRWVWRAAFRIARGELQARARRRAPMGPERTYELEDPDPELVRALARLSEGQRAAVVLHHVADYSVKEVAAILGSTSAAVRMQLTRGRRRLRELLEERDG
jgi:RNA polymerase sigma-70 factor (ECF subfamily)